MQGTEAAERLMESFAERTGLADGGDPRRRYLWTDACAVEAFLAGLLGHWDTIVHALLSGRVALDPADPDRARGRWYISEFGLRTDGTEVFFAGVYHDEYVQRDGTWYFDRRRYDSMFRRVGGEVTTSPFPTV